MTVKFYIVFVFCYLYVQGTTVAQKLGNPCIKDNCIQYDKQFGEKKDVLMDTLKECKIGGYTSLMNEKNALCHIRLTNKLGSDGKLNMTVIRACFETYSVVKYEEELSKIPDECGNSEPKDYYPCVYKIISKLCPNDVIFGKNSEMY